MIRFLHILMMCLLLIIGCFYWTDIELPDGRHIPKKFNFSIAPATDDIIESTLIDYNAIYYVKHNDLISGLDQESYSYYRFWPNGRVMEKLSNILPSQDDAEDFSNAEIGYFKIDGTELVIELFIPDTTIMNWGYILIFANIIDGKIVFNKTVSQNKVSTGMDGITYKPLKFDKLSREPDW
ncbi:MAG: hypothetical protein CSA22_06005 [Deltaproteobacteria bacterium]|nr:MAG: hypothetical protein CSA22_06005 [Deltaproteobacteria bacterium]